VLGGWANIAQEYPPSVTVPTSQLGNAAFLIEGEPPFESILGVYPHIRNAGRKTRKNHAYALTKKARELR
jgi:hypothetical protein